jgi:hypothetical protein
VSAAAVRVRDWLTSPTALRVPRITAAFWIIKLLSTAMGESTSDYLVHVMVPELAVLLGCAGFAVAPSRTGWESRAASAGWDSATAGWRSASPS